MSSRHMTRPDRMPWMEIRLTQKEDYNTTSFICSIPKEKKNPYTELEHRVGLSAFGYAANE